MAYWLFLRSLARDDLYVITRVPLIRCSLVMILLAYYLLTTLT